MVRLLSALLQAVSLSLCLRSVAAAPVSSIYIIEVDDDHTNIDAVVKDISTFTEAANVHTNVRFVYDSGPILGFSFTLSGDGSNSVTEQLQSFAGVKTLYTFPQGHKELKRDAVDLPSVWDASLITLPDDALLQSRQDSESGTWRPHLMTGVDKLHAAGIKGKGTTVAMIDMCWDVEQEALGGSIGPDKKLHTRTTGGLQLKMTFNVLAIPTELPALVSWPRTPPNTTLSAWLRRLRSSYTLSIAATIPIFKMTTSTMWCAKLPTEALMPSSSA